MKDLVQMIDGKAVTTSRKVAEVFEKQHKNILQAIRELEIPEEYERLNFQPTEYEAVNNLGKTVKYPEYLITRDGFTLLAMGFTGKKAMQFKIAYIEAFNAMEAQLKECSVSRKVDITTSTAALIEQINTKLIAGMEVEPEILRYAWNIGRLVGKALTPQKHVSSIENFIMGIAAGEYPRHEIYEAYCANCVNPISARKFWPIVRGIRPCSELRRAYCRLVVF